jgi:hypothetical protein
MAWRPPQRPPSRNVPASFRRRQRPVQSCTLLSLSLVLSCLTSYLLRRCNRLRMISRFSLSRVWVSCLIDLVSRKLGQMNTWIIIAVLLFSSLVRKPRPLLHL